MNGAGGTSGGVGSFFIGIFMMIGGGYMLLNSIIVRSNFGFGSSLYSWNMGSFGMSITSGMVLIPFMFGIAMLFYKGKSMFGWVLTLGSLGALVFGVISSIQLHMRTMSSFDLIVILVLCAGGLGLFMRSFKNFENKMNKLEGP
jgi:hypothetical protein